METIKASFVNLHFHYCSFSLFIFFVLVLLVVLHTHRTHFVIEQLFTVLVEDLDTFIFEFFRLVSASRKRRDLGIEKEKVEEKKEEEKKIVTPDRA